MTWEYALIGLVIGFIIGALVVRYGNSKVRQQKTMQVELEKKNEELEEYRKELVGHFARSARYSITWLVIIVSFISTWLKVHRN